MRNSTALKSFATSSRTSLIEQMRAQIRQLLADPKSAAEYPRELGALRSAVDAHNPAWVAETAAYTWFNRLTAARYMDANGFSGMYGVVSPESGSASALPEILTRAQAGDFPEEIPADVQSAVTDVLNGRRVSADSYAEAYGLLLGAVFRTWHQPMPEVFPATVDWIRLLTPVDILAPSSVRAHAVEVMDAEACENVEVVGWLYQFYNAELKEQINEAKAPIDAPELAPVTQLFTPHWIVRYLVENSLGRLWLRSRPSSQLRSQMNYYVEPIAGQKDTGVTVSSPEEIRVLDPACGSGHMLTYAFDLLYAIYAEEGYTPSSIPELVLTHNLRGLEIDERAAQLASFALAMKARGRDRRFFKRKVQPDIVRVQPVSFDVDSIQQIMQTVVQLAAENELADAEALTRLLYAFVDADTFGSLIGVDADAVAALDSATYTLDNNVNDLYAGYSVDQIRILARQAKALVDNQYHVVVANPPYLGSGNMGAKLGAFARELFPESKSDLYAMFIERNSKLAVPAGSVAMVTMHSWMFLTSYKKFRANLPTWGHLTSMAHLGTRAFDSIGGEVVQTAAFVIDIESRPSHTGIFMRLVDGRSENAKDVDLLRTVDDTENQLRFTATMDDFAAIPDAPVVYWLSEATKSTFTRGIRLADVAAPAVGLQTGDNDRFLRQWFEVSSDRTGFDMASRGEAKESGLKWFPHNKGGAFRKWWGNHDYVVNWENDGYEIQSFVDIAGKQRSRPQNLDRYFEPCISWSRISAGPQSFRMFPRGYSFNDVAPIIATNLDQARLLQGLLNSSTATRILKILSPTLHYEVGHVSNFPILTAEQPVVDPIVDELVTTFRDDWNDYEMSWDFMASPLAMMGEGHLDAHTKTRWEDALAAAKRAQGLEESNNRYFATLYELEDEVECKVPLSRISLTQNPYFRYAPTKGTTRTDDEYQTSFFRDLAKELISYAVGCMVGRYSLDKPGLVLADTGLTITDYDQKVPSARFRPDVDGILPITAGLYFEDDVVTRLREFLAVAFGAEYVETNVSWLEHALGSGKRKNLRDYFISDFYTDHVKTYSKRPIYWQVSSPKSGFNALFYLHRYTPATLGLIHQNYAEELLDKLQARLNTIEHALLTADKREAAQLAKERDQLTAQRREIRDWIDDALFPLASAEIALDLDDGVKKNYPKLQGAVKKVTGL
jgi:hypothetical protein